MVDNFPAIGAATIPINYDPPFVFEPGARYKITNTRTSGIWIMLTLIREGQRKMEFLFPKDDFNYWLLECIRTTERGRGRDALLGHWLVVSDDGMALSFEIDPDPSIEIAYS